jgi:UDP-N-acetylglucosamine acyltransferase
MARIHPTAVVDPGAELAESARVGPYVVIGAEVALAEDVEIVSHVAIMGRTSIGPRTRVFPFAILGSDPQVRGFRDEATALAIGADNIIREYVSIHVGTRKGGGCTRVGDDNLIMNNVHIAHDCQVGSHCELAAFSGMGGHVVLEDHVVLGGMTGIHQFVRVGESVFTAGNSMLVKDAPPFARVAGDRARFLGLNTLGLERRGFSGESIAKLKHAMHLLFHSKLRLAPALERVERDCAGSPEVAHLVDFLRRSERGVIR